MDITMKPKVNPEITKVQVKNIQLLMRGSQFNEIPVLCETANIKERKVISIAKDSCKRLLRAATVLFKRNYIDAAKVCMNSINKIAEHYGIYMFSGPSDFHKFNSLYYDLNRRIGARIMHENYIYRKAAALRQNDKEHPEIYASFHKEKAPN